MIQATIQLETLTCPSCLQKINGAVKKINGVDVETVNVMFNASRVRLNFDSSKTNVAAIEDSITKLGYDVKNSKIKSL